MAEKEKREPVTHSLKGSIELKLEPDYRSTVYKWIIDGPKLEPVKEEKDG